ASQPTLLGCPNCLVPSQNRTQTPSFSGDSATAPQLGAAGALLEKILERSRKPSRELIECRWIEQKIRHHEERHSDQQNIDSVFDGGRHYFHSNVLLNSRYAGLRLYSVIIGTGFDFWDHAAPNEKPRPISWGPGLSHGLEEYGSNAPIQAE